MGWEIALLPRHHLLRSFRAGCFVCTTAIASQPPQCVGGRRGKEGGGGRWETIPGACWVLALFSERDLGIPEEVEDA